MRKKHNKVFHKFWRARLSNIEKFDAECRYRIRNLPPIHSWGVRRLDKYTVEVVFQKKHHNSTLMLDRYVMPIEAFRLIQQLIVK